MSLVALALKCPACGRSSWRPDLDAGEHRLVRCPCGLRALDWDPTDAVALTANEEKYGGEDYNAWYRSMRDTLRARYARDCGEIEDLLRTAPLIEMLSEPSVPSSASTSDSLTVRQSAASAKGWPRGRLLDVGCAYGWFLEVARERGWDVAGVEATDATGSVGRSNGLHVRTGLLQDAGFADASFDVVCLWDVLEHVPDVDGFLAEIRRVLRPGGLLAIQSPNIRSVMARQAGADWSWLLLPHHVWHFTPASMKQTVSRRGFAVERLYTWEPPEAFVNDLKLYKRRPRLGSKAVRRLTDTPLALAEKLWCRAGFGGLVRAYARRLP